MKNRLKEVLYEQNINRIEEKRIHKNTTETNNKENKT